MKRFFSALSGAWLALNVVAQTNDSPAAELASFQVANGFEVSLFASESNGVVKPIQIRFDARGRLWVIGSTVYPFIEPGQKANDKVLVLEDTDRDGRADKTTVFADGLMIPTGLEVVENGCYVGHGTELLLLRDNDGDGKADERRVVLRGFGTGDNHQCINSFSWGPGGELFFCQGLHIRSHVETPWGIQSLEEAGLWRLRTRVLKLDGFYGASHEPQNPWGWVFTDWGEPIVIAGNNSSHFYPVPGMTAAHRTEAPPLIWKNGNGRKCSNGDIVGTTHFPDALQGALIVGGYINNAVWALKIREDGAGFALEDLPPLIKSTSRSFRPVDAKFGPDGALYIADWYNPIIGHYQASFRHPDRDKTHGRIWRVTAKGRALTPTPKLASASIPELLDALKSSDRWTRQFAKRVLAEKPSDAVVAELRKWTADRSRTEHELKEALGVFHSHAIFGGDVVAKLLRAKEPGARAYAANVIGAFASSEPGALESLRVLAVDENLRVRLQAVVACSYFTNAHAMEIAALAADQPVDRFIQYALNQTMFALKPYWLPQLQAGKLNLGTNATRWTMLVRADGTADTVSAVRKLLAGPSLDAASAENFWRILAEVGDANDLAALLKMRDDALLARVLPSVVSIARVRTTRPTGDLAALLQPLIEKQFTRGDALRLAGIWNVTALRKTTLGYALDLNVQIPSREAAITALGGFQDREALSDLAASERHDGIRARAIAVLTPLNVDAAAANAAALLAQTTDANAMTETITALLQHKSGAAKLARAFERITPSARAGQLGLELMNASGRRDEQLAAIFTKAAGLTAQNSRISGAQLIEFITQVNSRGDARRGAEIYARKELGCVACHAVNGEGGSVGPNLSALGSAQPVDFIVGAILEPQKEVKEGFTAIAVTMKDDEEHQGYLVRETKDELVIRDALQNKEVRLRRNAIADRRTLGSVMPAGLADTLTREEFRDLVRYLSELGRAK